MTVISPSPMLECELSATLCLVDEGGGWEGAGGAG